jgi:ferritin
MMLEKKLERAFNDQINKEFYSSYLYLAMAVYCQSIDLPGFAQWLIVQSKEEYGHAERLIKFVQDRDGDVAFSKIDKPQVKFQSVLDVFEKVLAHEQFVSKCINEIYALAVQEKDYASQVEMQWYIQEQVEEEKTAQDIVKQVKRVGNKGTALFMLDQKMGQRQPVADVSA